VKTAHSIFKPHPARFRWHCTLYGQAQKTGNMAPYMVISDAAVAGIAQQRPASLEALAALPGVPRATAQRFGPDLLECVSAYCARYQLPRTTAPPPAPPTASAPAVAEECEWRAKRPRGAPAGPAAGASSGSAAKQRKLPKSFR